jgi:hypothetical protein
MRPRRAPATDALIPDPFGAVSYCCSPAGPMWLSLPYRVQMLNRVSASTWRQGVRFRPPGENDKLAGTLYGVVPVGDEWSSAAAIRLLRFESVAPRARFALSQWLLEPGRRPRVHCLL